MNTTTRPPINLHKLNQRGRRQLAIKLRYDFHWPIRRIAFRLQITPRAVRQLLQRIASDPKEPPRMKPPRPRQIRLFSLSFEFDL